MSRDCTHCRRNTPEIEAIFCMYCGSRFGETQADPHATVDHIPSEAAADETVADAIPGRVGGYRILKRLGEGGMGSVYEAEADDTGKKVAVKLLAPKLASNPVSVERFRQEGRLASQISHPRCVFVYRADADAGRPFIVMELMPGKTLKDLVEQQGRLSPTDAVNRILDVIDGLIEAHRLGLIHRDVKPSNCFLTADDRVKIGDFGLSKSLTNSDQDGELTSTGAFLGTVLYAPPEQIRGEEVRYDSDVYSVCATLYFLLTGRAPYQHESMTAALARAISESPPRIRDVRPDVPRVFDDLIRRGLERDRNRRYSTLEELRDALIQVQPEEQLPARTRMLMVAYLIDSVIATLLVQIPIEIFEWVVGIRQSMQLGGEIAIDPLSLIGFGLYFAILEGFVGTTFGKWLLGLRVVPFGSVGPPAFGVATLRTAVFHFGVLMIVLGNTLLWELPTFGMAIGLPLIFGGIAYLAYRVRKFSTNRGLHDLATGTQVVQMPRRPHRVRLASRHPNRIDFRKAIPNPPFLQSGTLLRGELQAYANGNRLWVAEDRSLGRRILVFLTPGDAPHQTPSRPTRLRIVSSGTCEWHGDQWHWQGYAAPAGAPLADMIDPQRPLSWADTRLILEEVIEELIAIESDASAPDRLGIDQLWAEPGGRVYLLDFPLKTAIPERAAASPFDLVRDTATLLLEGAPRYIGGPVRAPLPPHASAITNRLFDGGTQYESLTELQCELAESHAHAPTVTTSMRAAHLGVTGLLVGFGLALMLTATLLQSLWLTLWTDLQRNETQNALAGLNTPTVLRHWQQRPELAPYLHPELLPKMRQNMETQRVQLQERFDDEFSMLTKFERFVAVRLRHTGVMPEEELLALEPQQVKVSLLNAESIAVHPGAALNWREILLNVTMMICGVFTLGYMIFAFCFRGGLAYLLSGIALVRRDGRPAGRFRCALRELIIWLPLQVMLLTTAFVQMEWPGWFTGRVILTGCTFAVIIGYIAVGFRYPEQGPHDRLTGTFRVPV